MSRIFVGTAAVAALVALGSAPASAQSIGIAINPYIGYYDFDESSFEDAFDDADLESGAIWGARLGLGGREGLSLDLGYGRASVDGKVTIGDVILTEDSAIHLFYGAVNYQLPVPVVGLFLSGGAGAIRYAPEDRDAKTDVLLNYGAGVSIPVGGVRIRADAKDHVDLCDAPDEFAFDEFGACAEDEALHNIELSAGIEIAL
jgi:hypothetical protein